MNVCLIFRTPSINRNSIEGVFKNIAGKLSNKPLLFFSTGHLWNDARILRSNNNTLFHITGDVNYLVILLLNKKTILTVHDIGHYKNLKGLKKVIYGLIWIILPCLIAKRITTVSEYTYNDLIKRFNIINYKKITIIPNPVSKTFKYKSRQGNIIPIILQIGTGKNKNLETVIRAIQGYNFQLHIVGPLSMSQLSLLKSAEIWYTNFVNISESEINNLYEGCDLVTFVSSHEGFGMPVIEANACGRPIICSSIPALKEVAGKAAHFIEDPNDHISLRAGIVKLVQNHEYYCDLVNKGLENAKLYSLEEITKKYEALYTSLEG